VRPLDTLLYRHANRDRKIVPKRQDVSNSGIPKSHCKRGVSLKFLEKATGEMTNLADCKKTNGNEDARASTLLANRIEGVGLLFD